MTAHFALNAVANAPTDAQLLACDAVLEYASLLSSQSAALIAAAAMADIGGVEAGLWACRHIFAAAAQSWREAVPPLPRDEGDKA